MESALLTPQAPRARALDRIEVIFKVAERCNINCSYCYVFNGADDSFRRHPARVAHETASATARFLAEAVEELQLAAVQVDFHGGEPLLLGPERFERLCETFAAALPPPVALTLCVQTNATLIDARWIDTFERWQVRVGTSIDGPAEYHDAARVDFAGRGTYERAAAGLRLLREAYDTGRLPSLGVLTVIDPTRSAARIYRHIVHDLGVRSVDFLLPDLTHDTYTPEDGRRPEDYGAFLCEAFDAWADDADPDIQVRVLNSAMSLLLGGRSWVSGYGPDVAPAVTVASDGSVGPDDLLRACGPAMMDTGYNVRTSRLSQVLASQRMREIESGRVSHAEACRRCCWETICGGGLLVNRYAEGSWFNNPSVFCEGLKTFYAHIGTYLIREGLPLGRLVDVLRIDQNPGPQSLLDLAPAPAHTSLAS